MNNTKVYTAQEFRAAAVSPMYVGGDCVAHVRPEVYGMLEQAADMREQCDKAVDRLKHNGWKKQDCEIENFRNAHNALVRDAIAILRGDAGKEEK